MKPVTRAKMLLGTGKGFRKVRGWAEMHDRVGCKMRVEWPKAAANGEEPRIIWRDATLLRVGRGEARVRLDSGGEIDFHDRRQFVVERLRLPSLGRAESRANRVGREAQNRVNEKG